MGSRNCLIRFSKSCVSPDSLYVTVGSRGSLGMLANGGKDPERTKFVPLFPFVCWLAFWHDSNQHHWWSMKEDGFLK